ncbi:MAG TPA: hypothetical protein VES20_13425 [Bryobacteraceae bacterium]|nr:hypothetical protein [Bryobacteraceae bacterium]
MQLETKKKWLPLAIAVLSAGLFSTACSMEKTQSAKAPDVDVDVDAGRWPKYDVKWADVDVGTTTKTVTVPKLEWRREQVEVQVPYIDIKGPGSGDREERTIAVELEVPNSGYDLQIREVRAAGNELWVISELKKTGDMKGNYGRVSDQVVINAPDDLQVRKVIIGERPQGVYNQQHTFYSDMSTLQQRLPQGGGRVLYQRNV